MSEKHWETYEEVARYLLDRIAEQFGISRFEGKQVLSGASGTSWEVDAKGCTDGDERILIVECKRYTKSGVPQAIAGSLAFAIQDVGADGGFLVSPLGLQEGAKKVANANNIVEVKLDENSTTTEYMMQFLNQFHFGVAEKIEITERLIIELRDADGTVIERREC